MVARFGLLFCDDRVILLVTGSSIDAVNRVIEMAGLEPRKVERTAVPDEVVCQNPDMGFSCEITEEEVEALKSIGLPLVGEGLMAVA